MHILLFSTFHLKQKTTNIMKVSLPHQEQQKNSAYRDNDFVKRTFFFQFHVSETISNGEIDIHDILNFF